MSDEVTPKARRGSNMFERLGITVGEFKELARKMFIPELAEHLGLSERCVQTWTKRLGVSHAPYRPKRRSTDLSDHNDFGCVAEYIKAHPGQKLPRSVKEIAELVGCSPNAVKCWLRRRRVRYTRYAEALGDLRLLPGVALLTDEAPKMRVPTRLFKSYSLTVNPRTLVVAIHFSIGIERNNRRSSMPLRAYYDLFQR